VCVYVSLLQGSLAKETYKIKEPTNRSHPIAFEAHLQTRTYDLRYPVDVCVPMGWLRFVGSLKLQVSFAKEPYKRDYLLQKRPIILKSLLIVAIPHVC